MSNNELLMEQHEPESLWSQLPGASEAELPLEARAAAAEGVN